MKLYCVAAYRNHAIHAGSRVTSIAAQPGDLLDLDDAIAEHIHRDAPDCFHRSESKTWKALRAQDGDGRQYRDRQMRNDRGGGESMSTGNMPGITTKGR